MDIKRTHRKGKHLNKLENYYIYKARRNNRQMNDTSTDTHNPIFIRLHETNNRYQHTKQPYICETEVTHSNSETKMDEQQNDTTMHTRKPHRIP
jgi:hypothetical protein